MPTRLSRTRRPRKRLRRTCARCFTGAFRENPPSADDAQMVTLRPKHPGRMFPLRSVENVIGWPSLDVRSMRIGLIWDSYITYEFHNLRRNQPLETAVFEVPTR